MYSIDHISINVINMEESIYFYHHILGLEQLEFVDMGDHYIQYLELNKVTRLELIEYVEGNNHFKENHELMGIYRHIALQVVDINAFRNALPDIKVVKMDINDCKLLNFKNMLILDPNNIEIEIIEKYKSKE